MKFKWFKGKGGTPSTNRLTQGASFGEDEEAPSTNRLTQGASFGEDEEAPSTNRLTQGASFGEDEEASSTNRLTQETLTEASGPLKNLTVGKDLGDRLEAGATEEPDMRVEVEETEEVEKLADGETEVETEVSAKPEKGVLRTENLVKKYGRRTVANNVSINVQQGEIVGLLGPNGAGKTTTFYMTTGLITPNAGKIFLDDVDITSLPVYKRAQLGIGYLPQEASVFRKLTVEDNIRAVLEMTNTSKEYQKEKLESLIKEFSLEKVRKNNGENLSGGERRRTEIARCLAINPKFIMLDEPFAGVDPIAVEEIQTVVYHLKEKNIGILITDHNAPETLSITDRAYLLFEGKILFQGTSEELAENPIVKEKYLGRNFIFRRKKF